MKNKRAFSVVALILVCFFSQQSFAQTKSGLSIYYNYSVMFQFGLHQSYPFGIGTSFYKPLNDRFFLRTGIGYSFKQSSHNNLIFIDQMNASNPPNSSKLKEASYLLNIGLYYQILKINDDLLIKIGANLVPSYVHSKLKGLDYSKTSNDYSMGISTGLEVEYSISKNISIFIEPEYLYYFLGDYSKSKSLNGKAGMIIFLK